MFSVKVDSAQFIKEMSNLVEYSVGFLEGAQRGKNTFLANLGSSMSNVLGSYIDSNARVDPAILHHMYEWEKSGSPDARLFDIQYSVTGQGLSINSTFRQSSSVKSGSKVPFYDKARIMEYGIPVTIRPKNSNVLAFTDGGEQVFTRNPVTIQSPGGVDAQGGFEKTFKSFFDNYFTQSFLQSSGLAKYLENPSIFSKGASLRSGGRSLGVTAGFKWITNAKIEAA
jgi:hypothetical protein